MVRAWHALAAYVLLALAATWPLAAGLARDVAWDLGDSLLAMWAIAWNNEQLLAILRGDLGRLATFFDANIFFPAPRALAYSEHFVGQSLQALPVYALTGNPILCYNLLFLSALALSGWATYLFVRELTGSATAGFIAGLLFTFAPYRLPQAPHLHVLSSQWMPFVLYGLRRYFEERRIRPLAGATAAMVMQALSSGYYLLYFTPFAAAYVLWEIASRGAWHDRRLWAALGAATALGVLCLVPFLLPYLAVRDEVGRRALGEVVRYSADVYSYLTASPSQPIWGAVARAFPKPEGELFPGLATVLLASLGLFAWRRPDASPARWRLAGLLLAAAALAHLLAAGAVLLERRVTLDLWLFTLRISNANQMILRAGVAFALLLAISPRARASTAAFMRGPGFFLACAAAAGWLSLGPAPQTQGRPVELVGPYALLYEYVPGFDGVRVPARFGMIVALMLAVLGGYGTTRLAAARPSRRSLIAAASLVIVAEGILVPFIVNGTTPTPGFNAPEARVYPPRRAPAVYRAVRDLPAGAVVAELPLGFPDFDARATYYSAAHWQRILNGYSGFFPPHYGPLALALSDVARRPDIAQTALSSIGTTHVLVHEGVYRDGQGRATTEALLNLGASEVFRDGDDALLRLPGR